MAEQKWLKQARAGLARAEAALADQNRDAASATLAEIAQPLAHAKMPGPALLRAARLHRQLGQPQTARDLFERALRITPSAPALLCDYADFLLRQGEAPAVQALLDRDLSGYPDPQRANFAALLGRAAMAQGQAVAAQEHLREALRLNPAHKEHRQHLARVLLWDQPAEARALAVAAAEQARPRKKAEMLSIAARAALIDSDHAGAEALALAARAADPDQPEAVEIQADILTAAGQTTQLRRLLTDWLGSHSGPLRLELRLAKALVQDKDHDAAAARLDQIAARPDLPPQMASEWASMMQALGRADQAVARLDTLIETGGATPPVFATQAQLLLALKRLEERRALISRCLEQFPGNLQVLRFLLDQGDIPPDPGLLRRLAAHLPSGQALHVTTRTLLKDRDYPTALALLRSPGNQEPSPRRSISIGTALIGRGALPLAHRYLRMALRRWPDSIALRLKLADALRRNGAVKQALAVLEDHVPASRSGQVSLLRQKCQLLPHLGDMAGTETALAALATLDPGGRFLATNALRQYISLGDYERARTERHRGGIISADTHPHWSISLTGQLYNEIEIEHRNGAALDPAPMGVDRLAQEVIARPHSNIVATRFLAEWLHDPRHAPDPERGQPIPQQVYQYWDSSIRPPEVDRLMTSWQGIEGWEHTVYDKTGAATLLRAEFGPKWLQAFRMANNAAEEADFLRLCLLARHGGVWADADDMRLSPLAPLLGSGKGLVVYHEDLGNALGNNFIASQPGHPAIVLAARQARTALLQRSNETTWSKTGPGLLARSVARLLAETVDRGTSHAVRILSTGQAMQRIAMHVPVQTKLAGKHWNRTGNEDRRGGPLMTPDEALEFFGLGGDST